MLTVQNTDLPGLFIITPATDTDVCGQTRAGFHPTQYAAFGMTGRFASDRFVKSHKGALRGLHTIPDGQSLLLSVVRGDISVVVVDLRASSRQFGTHHIIDIIEAQNQQVYIGGGMAYATVARSDIVDMHEKYTGFFDENGFKGVFWNDPSLGIDWPVAFPLVNDADARLPCLQQFVPAYA